MRLLVALAFAMSIPRLASAQDTLPPNELLVCTEEAPMLSTETYLRALSLDLRGKPPTLAELDVDEDMIEPLVAEWTASDEFAARAVRRHRALLWNDVSNVTLLNAGSVLSRSGEIHFVNARAPRYRGATVPCADVPATFDALGRPRIVRTETIGTASVSREGWVKVHPYWAPETEIKVCAFDAEDASISQRGVDCESVDGLADTGCGCGPELTRCATGEQIRSVARFIGLELEQRMAATFREGGHYGDLFTSRRAYVNGPLSHYYRHLASFPATVRFLPLAIDKESIPDLRFDDETWVEIELPEFHAGILTSPAYLLRFQTNRARASRFSDAFLCEPFTPPAGGLPASTDAEARDADLQNRSGCRYCHAQLEPAASRWGRWSEQGAAFLAPDAYPSFRSDCYECALGRFTCPPECSLRYVTTALAPEQRPYLGMLKSYEFRRPEHVAYIEDGPARLVRESIADGRLPRCVARRTAESLFGRPLSSRETPWLDGVTRSFVASGLDYPALVTSIVLDATYRSAR